MTATLAALVALTFFVGLVRDFPLTGQVHISPAPFDQALKQMPQEPDPQRSALGIRGETESPCRQFYSAASSFMR